MNEKRTNNYQGAVYEFEGALESDQESIQIRTSYIIGYAAECSHKDGHTDKRGTKRM